MRRALRALIVVLLLILFCQSCVADVREGIKTVREMELKDCLLWKREIYGSNFEESLIDIYGHYFLIFLNKSERKRNLGL